MADQVRAGRLRHRVALQNKSATQSGTGGEVPAWSALATRWAEVIPGSGGERFTADQDLSKINVRFVIRCDSVVAALKTTGRIVFRSKAYDIQAIANQNTRGRKLIIDTELSEARIS